MLSVSVVIPAYNSANHIRRSIESALNQTVLPLEIIVVNDGSGDETEVIANSYGGIVRVISKERNCGLPAARNFGIENASGEWIAFLDSDDEWEHEKNEIAIGIVKSKNVDWCMVAQTVVNSSDCKIDSNPFNFETYIDSYFSLVLRGKGCCPSSMMIKKSVFDKVGVFNEVLTTGEDLEMWWRIANSIPKIGYCPQSLVRYYIDVPGSMTSSPRNESKLIAFWESVTQISGSINDPENSELFMLVRDMFASKGMRFYIREGYHEVATYLKGKKAINYHPAMRLLLMLPYSFSRVILMLLYSAKKMRLAK
jgi:glycosyltransferase involved in cell wall biosynthesis